MSAQAAPALSSATILVEYRKVYGLVKIYPLNLGAKMLAEIAGTTTLSERALELALQLGHEIHRRGETLWPGSVRVQS
jgi:hypothetical protein